MVIKYYGYIYASGNGGDTPHCTAPVVGPPLPGVYPRTLVGEKITECDAPSRNGESSATTPRPR